MNNLSTTLTQASHQWASRPDDQRYLTLEALRDSVLRRKEQSWAVNNFPASLTCVADQNDPEHGFQVIMRNRDGAEVIAHPTHHAFGQLAGIAKSPAGYLRKLPAVVSAINMQIGLNRYADQDQAMAYLDQTDENLETSMRAITGVNYGRIWDIQVVNAVMNINQKGNWKVPAASYSSTDPLRATTLYASDRDVFIFLVDPDTEIEVGGSKLHRGFFAWNSETGDKTFGLTRFLYDYVCDNRMVWGATDIKELKIKHTGGAPDRFYMEAERELRRFANESDSKIIDCVARAAETELSDLPRPKSEDQTAQDWLVEQGFTQSEAKSAESFALKDRGSSRTLWDMVYGVTAMARTISHTDLRVVVERKAGDLMKMVE